MIGVIRCGVSLDLSDIMSGDDGWTIMGVYMVG